MGSRLRQARRWLGATALGVCLGSARAMALEAGEPAPALDLAGSDQRVTLPAPGAVIYLDFWASWCGPCRKSFPWMNAMQDKYAAAGLRVIGVNLDAEADDASAFLAAIPARFSVAYDPDGESARRFAVKGMPTSVLIGRDGTVVLRHEGFDSRDAEALEQAIRTALGAGS